MELETTDFHRVSTKKNKTDPKFYDLMKYETVKAAWLALHCGYGSIPD